MLLTTLTLSSCLVALALATAEPAPYKLERLGVISYNAAFGLAKRQAGYEPSQQICGSGIDCPSACGAAYVECASTDITLHCFNPSIKESCCPDGSGNSCSDGYFCTSDSTGGTWCCPDGLSLAACAAAYSLTGVLVSQTAAPTIVYPSSTPLSVTASTTYTPTTVSASVVPSTVASSSTSTSVSKSSVITTSSYSVTTTAVKATSTTVTAASSVSSAVVGGGNGTSTTSSGFVQVTGNAGSVVKAGVPVFALAVGAFFAM